MQLFGQPCECKGGIQDLEPNIEGHKQVTSQGTKYLAGPQLTTRGPIDCQDKTAYLTADISAGGYSSSGGWKQLSWKCVKKPSVTPTADKKSIPCNCNATSTFTVQDQMHSSCYDCPELSS